MPPGFSVDKSQQLHVSIAAVGPKGIPHYKSQWCLEKMANMENSQKLAFRQAHFDVYPALRKIQDVDSLTDWGKYEDAVTKITGPVKFGGIGMSYLLVDVLGFKTAVVSPAITASDADARPSSTIWNGNWATDALRTSEFAKEPKSIVEWIKSAAEGGRREEFIDEDGDNSFKASVTAADYYAHVKDSYAGEEAKITQDIFGILQSSIPTVEIPSMEET